jgi:hypothetical protein
MRSFIFFAMAWINRLNAGRIVLYAIATAIALALGLLGLGNISQ